MEIRIGADTSAFRAAWSSTEIRAPGADRIRRAVIECSQYENIKGVRVISRKALREFSAKHANSLGALEAWYLVTKRASWRNVSELKSDFPSADLVGRRTVFNIKGNTYRLIARVNHKSQKVFILHILTHAEYNKGDWKK
jgi:mRNA interferase HigB